MHHPPRAGWPGRRRKISSSMWSSTGSSLANPVPKAALLRVMFSVSALVSRWGSFLDDDSSHVEKCRSWLTTVLLNLGELQRTVWKYFLCGNGMLLRYISIVLGRLFVPTIQYSVNSRERITDEDPAKGTTVKIKDKHASFNVITNQSIHYTSIKQGALRR